MDDTHGPIQEAHRAKMNAVAETLDELFNQGLPPGSPRVVMVLLTAEAGAVDNGRVNYISTGDRDDMLKMIRELLGRMGG